MLTMLPWLTVLRAVPADEAQRLVLTALLVLTVPLIASMESGAETGVDWRYWC